MTAATTEHAKVKKETNKLAAKNVSQQLITSGSGRCLQNEGRRPQGGGRAVHGGREKGSKETMVANEA